MSRAVGLCADGVSSRVTHPAALPVEEPNVHTGRRVKGEGRQAVTAVPREKDFELCSRGFRAFSRFFAGTLRLVLGALHLVFLLYVCTATGLSTETWWNDALSPLSCSIRLYWTPRACVRRYVGS